MSAKLRPSAAKRASLITVTDHDRTTHQPNWIDAWLETQHDWLGRWQAAVAGRSDTMRAGMDILREHLNMDGLSPQATNVIQGFQTLLQSGMGAVGELAGTPSEKQLQANWWQQIQQVFPLGPAREQQALWQDYLKAQAENQLRAQAVSQAYGQVFAQSLQAVPAQIEARAAQGRPITGVRDLYELWIECGEQAFAPLARDPEFIAAQTASGNAQSRLKLAQQALMEQWLRQQDLPTRSELNSVHLRLREVMAKVAELEQQLAVKPRARKKTSTRRKD